MGLWGAAQALALGAGGARPARRLVDLARAALGSPLAAYALVFARRGVGFRRVGRDRRRGSARPRRAPGARRGGDGAPLGS